MAYNSDQGGTEEDEEEDEEQDPYYRGYPPQYYPGYDRRGYRPDPRSVDVELRSPGVARRFSRHADGGGVRGATGGVGDVVVMEESEEGA